MRSLLMGTFIFMLLSCTSCFKEDLSLTPTDAISDETFFTSEANAEAALIPMYRGRSFWRLTSFALEFYGDREGTGNWSGPANTAANQFSSKSVTSDNGFIQDFYRQLYGYIDVGNTFLANVDKVTYRDPHRKAAAKGEAHFMRAMYYYFLTMIYGSVPIVTDLPFPLYPSRATPEENYRLIINDLEFSVDNLPETNIGVLRPGEWECRPDHYAAEALLAKVLMTAPEPLYDLDRAISLINDVLDSRKYELEQNYLDLWKVDNKDNRENIFLINFTSKSSPSLDGSNAASLAVPGQVWFRATPEFYRSFEQGDSRKDVNIKYFPLFNEHYVNKMGSDPRAINGFTFDNYPQYVMRLGGFLLLKAEAIAKKDWNTNKAEACQLIEQVRNRAFKGADHKVYKPADFPTYHDFRVFLWWERRKELFYECMCFFDAKRMGMLNEMLGLDTWQEVLPFSTSDLTLNPNLVQNPGY